MVTGLSMFCLHDSLFEWYAGPGRSQKCHLISNGHASMSSSRVYGGGGVWLWITPYVTYLYRDTYGLTFYLLMSSADNL